MLTTSHGWPTTTTTVALAFFFLCCVSSGLLTHSILWNNIYVQIRVLPFVWQPSSVFRFLQSALCTVRAWKKFRRFRVSGWGFKLLLLTADDNDQDFKPSGAFSMYPQFSISTHDSGSDFLRTQFLQVESYVSRELCDTSEVAEAFYK